jgi:hypothetical protein
MDTRLRTSTVSRRSTRHVSEITAIASEYGNSAKIIVPRSRLGRRVIAFLHSDYMSKNSGRQVGRSDDEHHFIL